ncbi:MAG TPA: regulatory protein RecX [Gemmatimonadales bacterium]|nr:regulatory protein RecX [Gemmatimonadales bacterium]
MDTASRVTAIEHDPRRPGTVRLELDGTRFGVVPAELIAAEGLSPGQTIAPAVHDRLSAAADVEAAFRTGLRVLELRPYARVDLGRRLQRKGHPQRAVDVALERLLKLGVLNDEAYARSYVQTRAARGRGPSRLIRDLLSMGVQRSLIDGAIAAEWPEGSDRTSMPQALAAKRAAQLGKLPKQTKRRRLLAYLARRGFSGRDVTALVEGVL